MDFAAHTYDLYHDIRERTNGEIYIGVVGPVRTGKSTFIKRFMDEMVLPYMDDTPEKVRAQDEMPQSAGGKTITTTEPKFVPKQAAEVNLGNDIRAKVRLIDCVGYMVEGATGHLEDDKERMVKTPWLDYEIPFTQAAQIGTDKVMTDHSTIGLVITTDGSIGDIPRASYLEAEEKTIQTLKSLNKPFLVLVNSQKPYGEEAKQVARSIEEKHGVGVYPVNCEQLRKEDILSILERILYEFPISALEMYTPKWIEMMATDHPLRNSLLEEARRLMDQYTVIRDILQNPVSIQNEYITGCRTEQVSLSDGRVRIQLEVDDRFYYQMLSNLLQEEIKDEYQLLEKLSELARMKAEYSLCLGAMNAVRMKGYGVVSPKKEEIHLDLPEVIKHGNKFGVKIHAVSPSIHMIKADIETEIAPIVGTKEQAEDLIAYIKQTENETGIWNTNIFGKTVEQLVEEGIQAKIVNIGDECQIKLQDTMQKIVNDSNGGMICIII